MWVRLLTRGLEVSARQLPTSGLRAADQKRLILRSWVSLPSCLCGWRARHPVRPPPQLPTDGFFQTRVHHHPPQCRQDNTHPHERPTGVSRRDRLAPYRRLFVGLVEFRHPSMRQPLLILYATDHLANRTFFKEDMRSHSCTSES